MRLTPHPDRDAIAEEMHSRPHAELESPCAISHLAIMTQRESDGLEAAIAELCRRHKAPPPRHDRHHAVSLGGFRLRWERHVEFVSLSFIQDRRPRAMGFRHLPIGLLPDGWLAGLEGELIAATHVVIEPADPGPVDAALIDRLFEGQQVTGGAVMGGSAEAYTPFRQSDDGFGRFYVRDRGLGAGAAGRLAQRLVEIDTYRMMALLGLPLAKEVGPKLTGLEFRVADLVAELGHKVDLVEEEVFMSELFAVAQAAERLVAQGAFRFSASASYGRLVRDRLQDLRESRLGDLQPIGEFLERRLEPVLRTCASIAERQESLSGRIARTSSLARTRIEVALQKQNRALLASMERRTRVQLRLQATVEKLSVAAIGYYTLGIVAHLLGGFMPTDTLRLTISLLAPVFLFAIWLALRRSLAALMREG